MNINRYGLDVCETCIFAVFSCFSLFFDVSLLIVSPNRNIINHKRFSSSGCWICHEHTQLWILNSSPIHHYFSSECSPYGVRHKCMLLFQYPALMNVHSHHKHTFRSVPCAYILFIFLIPFYFNLIFYQLNITGLVWLRRGTGGELLWIRYWTFGIHNMLGNCGVA
jgi:hypothetical protein